MWERLSKINQNITFQNEKENNIFIKILLILRFIYRNIKNPIYFSNYVFTYFKNDFSFNPYFYNIDEIKNKIENGKSLIRYGDGEFAIINGVDIHFQKYEKEIGNKLFYAIENLNNNSKYILGINKNIINKSNHWLKEKGELRMWLPTKIYYYLYFNKNVNLFDHTCFYHKHFFKNLFLQSKNQKNFIIITRKGNIETIKENIKENKIPNKIYFIETPSQNSYFEKERIESELNAILEIEKNNLENILLMPACGPYGKILILKYIDKGIQGMDIGKGIEIAFNDKSLEHEILK